MSNIDHRYQVWTLGANPVMKGDAKTKAEAMTLAWELRAQQKLDVEIVDAMGRKNGHNRIEVPK